MKNVIIYLAGGINGLPDSDCKDWREEIKQIFPQCVFLDPMRRDYRGREMECYKEIVEGDIADVRDCDIFIAYIKQPSVGTSMEIFFSHSIGKKPIVFWDSDRDPSPWLSYHGKVFRNKLSWVKEIDKCVFILERIRKAKMQKTTVLQTDLNTDTPICPNCKSNNHVGKHAGKHDNIWFCIGCMKEFITSVEKLENVEQ